MESQVRMCCTSVCLRVSLVQLVFLTHCLFHLTCLSQPPHPISPLIPNPFPHPSVLQVRWLSWRKCWVTAADDDMIRLWSPEGIKMHQFAYGGGSVQVGVLQTGRT